MNTKNALKRTAAFLSAFLCSAFMFTGISRAGAESERTINTVNYGTEDNMIFADKGFVTFSVTDENGNPLDEGDFILTDSEGVKVVSWRGNELSQMGISSQSSASSVDSKSRVYVYGEQIPDFSEGKGYTRSTSVKTGEKSSALIYPDGAGAFVTDRLLKRPQDMSFTEKQNLQFLHIPSAHIRMPHGLPERFRGILP